jgi:hypothetical protein
MLQGCDGSALLIEWAWNAALGLHVAVWLKQNIYP